MTDLKEIKSVSPDSTVNPVDVTGMVSKVVQSKGKARKVNKASKVRKASKAKSKSAVDILEASNTFPFKSNAELAAALDFLRDKLTKKTYAGLKDDLVELYATYKLEVKKVVAGLPETRAAVADRLLPALEGQGEKFLLAFDGSTLYDWGKNTANHNGTGSKKLKSRVIGDITFHISLAVNKKVNKDDLDLKNSASADMIKKDKSGKVAKIF